MSKPSREQKAEVKLAEVEAQKKRLKTLIVLGKDRGYLTYAEINDHLPDDMTDAEQIEGVVTMLADMGISVYDEAPDAEQLLMNDTTPRVADEAVLEEAEEAAVEADRPRPLGRRRQVQVGELALHVLMARRRGRAHVARHAL